MREFKLKINYLIRRGTALIMVDLRMVGRFVRVDLERVELQRVDLGRVDLISTFFVFVYHSSYISILQSWSYEVVRNWVVCALIYFVRGFTLN